MWDLVAPPDYDMDCASPASQTYLLFLAGLRFTLGTPGNDRV